MDKIPTDLQILKAIYKQYVQTFREREFVEPPRVTKIYVPIDVRLIAKHLGTDPDELFGRLYYHLDHVYSYKQENGAKVHLFAFAVGEDRHCINFPYLAAVLAERQSQHKRELVAIAIAVFSLVISIGSLVAQALSSGA